MDWKNFGYLRCAVCSPEVRVGDVTFNVEATIAALRGLAAEGVQVSVFPELGLTGYSCADLFYQKNLIDGAEAGLRQLVDVVSELGMVVVVGLPISVESRLYNCAAVLTIDGIAGVIPKTCLPTTGEFYEERWFSRAATAGVSEIRLCDQEVPFGTDLIFSDQDNAQFRLGVEVCEDLWGAEPLSGPLATAGATVLANPSASNEILGKASYRRELVRQQSARCLAGYLYAAAGPGESSTDVVYSGHGLIAECGNELAETRRFQFTTEWSIADVDLDRIQADRQGNSTFSASRPTGSWRIIEIRLGDQALTSPLRRSVSRTPFIPGDAARRADHCREIFAIQSTGLARRLRHIQAKRAVIGVSGGLDSTLALLVTIRALATAGLDPSAVEAIVMPGPGSSDRTQSNARRLIEVLGGSLRVIEIGPAAELHLRDIGHPEGVHDATYENAQARERTQILMNVANQIGGIVVGTGDLSELALGWCTFNGDHMSMYHVNAGVPKTLVRHLIEWCADEEFEHDVASILNDICDTPISPELLPPSEDGSISQETEVAIGPYVLHDFFLFHVIRHRYRPAKVLALAVDAFEGIFDESRIRETLQLFYRRFFANQFKRSAMPDGPKVGTVALSPRGDWRMPSDASAALWLEEIS